MRLGGGASCSLSDEPGPELTGTGAPVRGSALAPGTTWALAVSFCCVMGVQMVSPLLPAMRHALHLSSSQAGWLVGVFSIAALAGTFPAGLVADRLGPRVVLLPSLVVYGVTGLSIPLVHTYSALLALRALQGLGYAVMVPLTITVLISAARPERIALVQGRRVMVMSTAEFLLPLISGLLLTFTGHWQVAYAMFVVPVLLAMWSWRMSGYLGRESRANRLDRAFATRLLLAAREPAVTSLLVVGFVRWWLKYSFFTYGPLFLSGTIHLGAGVIGTVIAAQGLLSAAVASQSGRLGLGWLGRAAFVASVAGMGLALAGLAAARSVDIAVACCALLGAFDGVVGSLMNALVAVLPAAEVRTTIVAVSGTTRNLGKAVAPPLAGSIIAALGYRPGLVVVATVGIAAPAYLFPLLSRRLNARGAPLPGLAELEP